MIWNQLKWFPLAYLRIEKFLVSSCSERIFRFLNCMLKKVNIILKQLKQNSISFLLRIKKIMKILKILLNIGFVKKASEEREVKSEIKRS